MSHAAINPSRSVPAPARFKERCDHLGVTTWRYSAASQVIAPPTAPGPAGVWLRSPYNERAITVTVKQWMRDDSPEPIELYPGFWVIPILETHRCRRTACTVAVALTPELFESEEFLAACGAAQLDAEATRSSLAPLAVFTCACAPKLAMVLSWLHHDIESSSRHEQDLSELSNQLTETYEEVNLLYSLGRSMNELVHPDKFVRVMCQELHDTLPFRWIAARFVTDENIARSMAGKLFSTGDLPCNECEFEKSLAMVLSTCHTDRGTVLDGKSRGPLGRGASQLLIHPIRRDGNLIGALFAGDKEGDDRQVSNVDMKLLETAAGYLTILLDNANLYEDQQLMFLGTLEALTSAIDAKDPYTCGHSERVATLSQTLALASGMDEAHAERIRIGGLVHDVGKIGVPESVLCKAGKLTDEEYDQIKQHPKIGFEILKGIPQLHDILPGVLHHHERWDGRGYPSSIAADNIPYIARIIGLVDAFDAMSSNRTYRNAMPRERVLDEIRRNAGIQFDAELVEIFLGLDLDFYDEMVARHHAEAARGSLRIGRESRAA